MTELNETQTTINSIKPIGNFTFSGKTYHSFEVTDTQGNIVQASSTSTSPWWKDEGTNVKFIYKNKKSPNGLELVSVKKIDFDNNQPQSYTNNTQSTGSAPTYQKTNIGVEVGQALNKAIDVMVATSLRENGYNPETFEQELHQIAASILKVGNQLRNYESK